MNQLAQVHSMFWLNVDIKTNMWKLHEESCRFCVSRESISKGLDKMKQDGGWFKFSSVKEAYLFYEKNDPNAVWQTCRVCRPE